MLSWALIQPLMPWVCTCEMDASVGPNVPCTRRRAASPGVGGGALGPWPPPPLFPPPLLPPPPPQAARTENINAAMRRRMASFLFQDRSDPKSKTAAQWSPAATRIPVDVVRTE